MNYDSYLIITDCYVMKKIDCEMIKNRIEYVQICVCVYVCIVCVCVCVCARRRAGEGGGGLTNGLLSGGTR